MTDTAITEPKRARSISREEAPFARAKQRSREQCAEAILSGRISRKPCECCGNRKSEAHHEDYSRPLEVKWLCRLHHGETHRKTHCKRGHELTGHNVILTTRGNGLAPRRKCRACTKLK